MEQHPPAPHHLSFWEHVGILRAYLLAGAALYVGIAVVSFAYFDETLIAYLLDPLRGQTLLFLSPMGPFLFKIKIALYAAFIGSFPFWLGLLFHFISPALSAGKRLSLALFAFFSLLLGVASLAITYLYFVPATLKILQGFAVAGTESLLTAELYLSFCILLLAVVFIILQIPVVMAALAYIGLLNPAVVGRYRKLSTVGIIAALAIITPTTDILTLLMTCVPALLLWELGLLISKGLYKK